MRFSRAECEYTKFNIENHKLGFAIYGKDDSSIVISVPFADDTPECIKDKLNDIIYQVLNEHLMTTEHIIMPCGLRLNASMQIKCSNEEKQKPEYYIFVIITDAEVDVGTWIDKRVDISVETAEFQKEFILYCQKQVNELLFPVEK